VKVGILLTSVKHSHDGIISLRGEVWADKTSLILTLLIEVTVPRHESERRSCIHVHVC